MPTFTENLYRNLHTGVRIAIAQSNARHAPYACIVSETQYNSYIRDYKSDIMPFLPVEYLGYTHQHVDTYIHFGKMDTLKTIVKNGYLTNEYSSSDNTIGKAIYTYPLRSLMYFYNDIEDYGFLVFKTDAKHVHLVQTDDGVYGCGEANFLEDKVYIQEPRILTSEPEMDKLSQEVFDWELAKTHYYGLPNLPIQKPNTVEELMDILDWFSCHSLATKDAYDTTDPLPSFLPKGE